MAKTFEHSTGTLTLYSNRILHLKVKEGVDASVSDVEAFIEQKRRWKKDKMGLIIDRQEAYSASVEIFERGIDDLDRDFAAIAYIAYSEMGEIASKEVIAHRLANIPTKIFYDLEEAVNWLEKTLSELLP